MRQYRFVRITDLVVLLSVVFSASAWAQLSEVGEGFDISTSSAIFFSWAIS